jgi:hypothetical protein
VSLFFQKNPAPNAPYIALSLGDPFARSPHQQSFPLARRFPFGTRQATLR